MLDMHCHETSLRLGPQEFALKIWQPEACAEENTPTVLALHGWLDNAASFDLLAPLLQNIRLITFDLPGHGLSSHRAMGDEYYIWSYVEDVLALADALELPQFALLGHSMGGAIASLVSSLYPERVQQLALLDAVGPLATEGADAPAQMRKALKQKKGLKSYKARYYPSKQAAIGARARNGIRLESATILAERSIRECKNGFWWDNDPRLSRVNLLSMTEEQVASFLRQITCPTYLVASSKFWQSKTSFFAKRLSYYEGQNNFAMIELDGSHHQHLEGQVEQVATALNQFFATLSVKGTQCE